MWPVVNIRFTINELWVLRIQPALNHEAAFSKNLIAFSKKDGLRKNKSNYRLF